MCEIDDIFGCMEVFERGNLGVNIQLQTKEKCFSVSAFLFADNEKKKSNTF